jgi:hypothetical protein
MLQLSADVRFTTTARIKLKGLKAEFEVECLLLPPDEVEALRAQMAENKLTLADFIKRWLVGWPEGQVADKAGQAVPFSDAAVAELLRVPGAPMALVNAFYDGYDQATEGNSAPLPAGS